MQLHFPASVREAVIAESNIYSYFRKMVEGGWQVHKCQQVTTTLPFLIVQVGAAEQTGGIFLGTKRSWEVEGYWSRMSTSLSTWCTATHLCRSICTNTNTHTHKPHLFPPFLLLFCLFFLYSPSLFFSMWLDPVSMEVCRYPCGYFPVPETQEKGTLTAFVKYTVNTRAPEMLSALE